MQRTRAVALGRYFAVPALFLRRTVCSIPRYVVIEKQGPLFRCQDVPHVFFITAMRAEVCLRCFAGTWCEVMVRDVLQDCRG